MTAATDDDLPVDPFVALRVAYGMLLGEDDFRVLSGNPRGKQMLHASWLHGRGVVWGLPVHHREGELVVGPGLALDGRGRELRVEVSECLPVTEWAKVWARAHPSGRQGCISRRVRAWVVARFRACPFNPVPALSDPCDVTRRHDDWSRILESTALDLVTDPPHDEVPYRRLRELLGVTERTEELTEEIGEAVASIVSADPDRRAEVLLHVFRRLAARDVVARRPERSDDLDGEEGWPALPSTEEHAEVVLARVVLQVTEDEGCVSVGDLEVDPDVRTALLPTATLSDLLCGFAPGLLGDTTAPDAHGPRLIRRSVRWRRGGSRLRFRVTRAIARGSEESGVEVSSLDDRGRGWSNEGIDRIHLDPEDPHEVIVDLNQRPAFSTVRVIVRGTGPYPLVGDDPRVPFAGIEGSGPPGTETDGHDAVLIVERGEE